MLLVFDNSSLIPDSHLCADRLFGTLLREWAEGMQRVIMRSLIGKES